MKLHKVVIAAALLALPAALLVAPAANAAVPIPNVTITVDSNTDCTWDGVGTDPSVCVAPTVPTVSPGTKILILWPNGTAPRHSGPYSTTFTTPNGEHQEIPGPQNDFGEGGYPYITWSMQLPFAFDQALNTDDAGFGPDTIHSLIGEDGVNVEMDFTMRVNLERLSAAPQSLTSKRLTSTSASIAWLAPTDAGGTPVTKYIVKRTNSTGSWSTSVPASSHAFTFTLLKPGVGYTLSVQAVTAAGASPVASSTVPGSSTAMNAASTYTAYRTGDNTAYLTWATPTTTGGHIITGYRVTRDGVDQYGGGAYSHTVSAATRGFFMNYLVQGVTYNLSVQPLYSGGTGQKANIPVFIG